MAEYWDPGERNKPENKINSLSFLHLNISSLLYHFSELQALLSSTKINFDIILISLNQESNKIKTLPITLTFKTIT